MRNGEADPTTGANCGGLTNHDVANAKAGQGDLLTMVPVVGRLPRKNGPSQLTQFIAVHNTLTLVGLPSGADGPFKL